MMYLILFALVILFAVLWYRARERADFAEAGVQVAAERLIIAERKAAGYKEALETSYIGLQALAEKNLELEWIRKEPGNIVQPGIWIGDEFVAVEDGESSDIEVGSQVAGDFDTATSPLPRTGKGETYDWKAEMP